MKVFIAAAVIIVIAPHLPSCSTPNALKEKGGAAETSMPIAYINGANSGAREQSISDLYKNAGANDKIFPRDPFNLTLSHNNYFYTDSICLEITCGVENAEIYYTLDSSIPSKDKINENSKNKGTKKYTEPILFDKTDNNSPYVIKIKAYSADSAESLYSESRVITHTYFVSEYINDRFDKNTFVFAISSDPDNLYGYENGILIEGKLRDDFKKENRRHDIIPPDPANYNLRGREGERESYIEVLKADGKLLISQTAGIRVHGAWSRAADRKSLALYARGEYDYIFDKFYYPFFNGSRRNDEYGTFLYDYKTLLLRNGANDRYGAFMREEFAHGLAKKAGFTDYHEFAPAAVFVNGEYYGFFWLHNFYSDYYFEEKYDVGNKNLIEVLEWGEPMNSGSLSKEEGFEEFCESVDIDNFMKYYAFEIYARNWDWPHNNRKWWRYAGENGGYINKYLDGKYRMLLYDAEGGWGDWAGINERTITRIKNDGSSPVFTALMKREDMQEKFCNQMYDLLNTVFTYSSMTNELHRITDLYDYEIGVAVKKKVLGSGIKNIERDRQNIVKFADKRELFVIEDMVKSFKLSGNIYHVNAKGSENADIVLSTLSLNGAGSIYGCYFYEHSVKLTAKPHPGYLFDYWLINGGKYDSPELTLTGGYSENSRINAELFTKPDPSYSDIVIKRIRLDGNCDIIELYNPGENETVISDCYLSNDKSNLQKFYIKKVTFPAKAIMKYYGVNYIGYLKSLGEENKYDIKANHIFDFKIQKGETVYLSDKDGKIMQKIYIPKNFNPDRNEQITRNNDGSYSVNRIK